MATLIVEIENQAALLRLEELQTLGILRIQNHAPVNWANGASFAESESQNPDPASKIYEVILEKRKESAQQTDAQGLNGTNFNSSGNVSGLMGTMSRTTVEDTERQLKEMREEWD